MTISFSNVEVATDTFNTLVQRTNQLLNALKVSIVTVGGNSAVGSASISGTLTANTLNSDMLNSNTTTFSNTTTISLTSNSFITNTASIFVGDIKTLSANTATLNYITSNTIFSGNTSFTGTISMGIGALKITGSNTTHKFLTSNANGNVQYTYPTLADLNITTINANTLNGQLPAYYQNSSNQISGTLPDARLTGSYSNVGAISTSYLTIRAQNSTTDGGEIALGKAPNSNLSGSVVLIDQQNNDIRFVETAGSNRAYFFNIASGSIVHNVSGTFWNSTNHGPGSGLNADLLDGQDSPYYTNIVARLGYTPLNLAGGNMTGQLGLAGTGSNFFAAGNGDAASYSTYNIKMRGHWGIGMETYDGIVNGFYDFRSGKWDTKGGFFKNGVAVVYNDSNLYNINITGSAGFATNSTNSTNASSSASLKQNGNGSNMTFYWSGQGGQPTWLWGGNDGTNHYVYNPSNFSVNYATTAGNANALGGLATGDYWNRIVGQHKYSNDNVKRFHYVNGSSTLIYGGANDGLIVDFRDQGENSKVKIAQDGNIYSLAVGGWLTNYINQDVRSGTNPNFYNPYIGYIGTNLSNRLDQDVRTSSQPNFYNMTIGYMSTTLDQLINQAVRNDSETNFLKSAFGDARFGNWINNGVVKLRPTAANEVGLNIARRGDQTAQLLKITNTDGSTLAYFDDVGRVGGNGAYVNTSDERVKHNIELANDHGLKTILKMTPKYFVRNTGTKRELGFIAQDMERVLPIAVQKIDSDKEDSIKAIATEMVIPVLVNAIKELNTKIERLENVKQ